MFIEDFALDEGDFNIANGATWEAAEGNTPGCLKLTFLPGCDSTGGTGGDVVVSDGSVKFHYKFVGTDGVPSPEYLRVTVNVGGGIVEEIQNLDGDWQLYTIDTSAYVGQNVSGIGFDTNDAPGLDAVGYVLIDNVYFGTITGGPEDPAAPTIVYDFSRSAGGVPGSIAI